MSHELSLMVIMTFVFLLMLEIRIGGKKLWKRFWEEDGKATNLCLYLVAGATLLGFMTFAFRLPGIMPWLTQYIAVPFLFSLAIKAKIVQIRHRLSETKEAHHGSV